MVVQRTLAKIEELKERPHHERRTVALYWAVAVVVLLTLFWGFFAVRGIGRTAIRLTNLQHHPVIAPQTAAAETAAPAASTASAAAAVDSAMLGAPPQELTASSTNGHVDLVPVRK